MQKISRLKRELQLLTTEPPPGITCWQAEGQMDDLRAQIIGGSGTPFEGGVFLLEIKVPERYPFEPPQIRYLTPIYHPNIDNAGRICHDALKLPPKGAWKPSLNIPTVLTSLQLLMAEPNPDDPLMADISSEFKYNKQLYLDKARKWTQKHAMQKNMGVVESKEAGKEEEKTLSRKRDTPSGQEQPGVGPQEPKRVCV
ncbi:ubiquitin-conjugating enzyme E2 T isoform X2 [Hypomesus transpacificus]|nr:ubiquitin-conjugating enzyme E2 T isoform X2 [Hypomesus transpacificus]XP_046896221.1 ubiquitin-conjugating enzyme E2 T isoform X2 [Hypomesus transpacificus]XP_046896222.1 ubiquitin-conjugating enzyme E2 T isoform X2 [Hypomesus transpacificus]XP_046896223.1 ubiquitin-conjugating enzyme E2 T isoform X2 [Hypomesus transpacificus]XP_046896224.1 ubiquitin-conjugating enzyme E2 T isoform X2 [Hypomesus transpacificus]